MALALALIIAPSAARASIEDALNAARAECGLLPDADGGFSAETLLSEMQLRLLQDEQDEFAKLYSRMEKYFQSPLLLLYCKLDPQLRPAAFENCMSLDLTLCRLLLNAAQRWNVEPYRERALKGARRILRFNVYRGVLVDSAHWKERESGVFSIYEPSHVLTLSGIDVQALQMLQAAVPEWEPIAQRCLGILLAGSGEISPRSAYDVEKRAYLQGGASQMNELFIVKNLIEGGLVPLHQMRWLVARVHADPTTLARGEDATLATAALGSYILAACGYPEESDQVLACLRETYVGDGLLAAKGEKPSLIDNLIYLTTERALSEIKNARPFRR